MLGILFSVFCLLSTLAGIAFGTIGAVSQSIMQSAQGAITLSFGLLSGMCLWCGVLNVLRQSGVTEWLSQRMSFLLGRLFPTAWRTGKGKEEICAAFTANLLGLGNAATPLALCAMRAMAQENHTPNKATDDMVTFTVMSCAPCSLLPTTLLSLRQSAGAVLATDILPLVWICSFAGCTVSVLLARGLRRVWR